VPGVPANAGGIVLVSLCYVMLGRLLQLALLCFRSNDFKELEIAVRGTNSPSSGDEPVGRR
jgi:hypothetical protein